MILNGDFEKIEFTIKIYWIVSHFSSNNAREAYMQPKEMNTLGQSAKLSFRSYWII